MVAAATPGKGVALPVALAAASPGRHERLRQASLRASAAAAGRSPLFKASAGPRWWRLRLLHAGGGARGSSASQPAHPRSRSGAQRRLSPCQAPARSNAGIASGQSTPGLGQHEQHSPGAVGRRLVVVSGKISASLPPLPSSSSNPSTSLPRPALRRRGTGPPAASLSPRPWDRASVGRQPRPRQLGLRTVPCRAGEGERCPCLGTRLLLMFQRQLPPRWWPRRVSPAPFFRFFFFFFFTFLSSQYWTQPARSREMLQDYPAASPAARGTRGDAGAANRPALLRVMSGAFFLGPQVLPELGARCTLQQGLALLGALDRRESPHPLQA